MSEDDEQKTNRIYINYVDMQRTIELTIESTDWDMNKIYKKAVELYIKLSEGDIR